MNYNGKNYKRIRPNLFGELTLNGEVLNAGDYIAILRLEKDEPYEEFDTVFYGNVGYTDRKAFQLENC
jgi:hypothetical protein